MQAIPIGAKGSFALLVGPQHLANQFKDAILLLVLATPVMIMTMENAALNALKPFLDPGESALGTAIDIRHLAATPLGHEVRSEAEVTKTDGRRVQFDVRSFDGDKLIGSGTHERVVVDVKRLLARLG